MNEHLYAYLNEWAKDNQIQFWVNHYDNCHTLNVTHALYEDDDGNTIVRHVIVEYPHKGGSYTLQPWVLDDVMREFIRLAEMFWSVMPKQPCGTLGYEWR